MRYLTKTVTFIFLMLFSASAHAEYGVSWALSLGCPTADQMTGSGAATITNGGFSTSGGSCSRLSNQFAKFSFSGSTGGTLNSTTVYPLQAGKLSLVPPLRNTDTSPLLAVEATCPTATRDVNWIHILSAASRTSEYFWGLSTMTPTSTTMSQYFDIAGTQGFSGSYSLPVGACSSGSFELSGTADFLATISSGSEWSGFYKTSPGNTTFFAPVWTITASYLGSKTYAGLYFNAQDPSSSKQVRVTSDAAGLVYTVKPFSDPETDTLDSSGTSYTETITITAVNSPLNGMMKGTISRVDSTSSPVGTTESIGCVAHDSGAGGYLIVCAGKNPFDNTKNYAVVFNYKPPSGQLDPGFGTAGVVRTSVGTAGGYYYGVALQSDGKIVTVGTATVAGNGDFVVARYNTDGSLDTSFNSTGIVTTDITTRVDTALTVAIQPDGKIVAAGSSHNGSNNDFAVVRYNTNGSLDTSFSSDGMVSTAIGPLSEYVRAVAFQSDGKIVVTGETYNGSDYDWAIVRYNTDGSLDTTFNSTGIVTTAIGSGIDMPKALSILSSGKILVGGYTYPGADFALARYNSDGSLDTTFNTTGKVVTSVIAGSDGANAMAVQADGKIVLGGYATAVDWTVHFALVRYTSAGALDTSFNSTGKVETSIGTSNDTIIALGIQADGKIVAVGSTDMGSSVNGFVVARYTSAGALDTTFNGTGYVTTASGRTDTANGATIQADGKIVAVGTNQYPAFGVMATVIRYWP